jgi:F-type H+-transporting ATPase subunit delta
MNNNVRLVAKEYGKFLIGSSSGQDSMEEINNSLSYYRECLANEEFRDFIYSPRVKLESKLNVVDKIKTKNNLSNLVLKVISVLIRKGHISFLPLIEEEFYNLSLEHRGITEVKCTSFKELTEGEKQSVKDLIEKELETSTIFKWHIDSALLGGVVFEFNNKIIDISYHGILNKLEKESLEVLDKV